MISHFLCWGKGKIKAGNLKEEAKKEMIADLLGLRGIRYGNGEFEEYKHPYPDKTIKGLAWKIRLKRFGTALGQPFCLDCKIPMYDYTSSSHHEKPIAVTIVCRKCKKNYVIEDLEETIKNHNFDILHDQNYLYKCVNTDVVGD